jgi:pantoate--beta-alanine ligase
MGNLHAGHASLIDRAAADGHFVAVTIFVNPTQFGPGEDFARYPRTPTEDLELCRGHGAAAVFMPTVDEMYGEKGVTTVSVASLTGGLCGRSRPGHFDGVCTVVAKLFNIAGPEAAYFGQKDAQQCAVIARMIADLNFPIRMVICPTVREADGLTLSSRNRYLSPAERQQAPQLYAALKLAASMVPQGTTDANRLAAAIADHLARLAPLGKIEYVEIVNPHSLSPVQQVDRPVLAALAVRFDSARLIDNMRVEPEPSGG